MGCMPFASITAFATGVRRNSMNAWPPFASFARVASAAEQERAVALGAHLALHLDRAQRHVLLGIEPHLLVVRLIGRRPALFGHLALILGELLLLLGVDALLLRRRFDALVQDGVRRIGAAERHVEDPHRDTGLLDDRQQMLGDDAVDLFGGGGLDRHLVHAVGLDRIAHGGAKRLVEIAHPEPRRAAAAVGAEVPHQLHAVDDLQADDRMEIDRHTVRGHQVGELGVDAHRLHVDVHRVRGEGHVLQAGLDGRAVDATTAEDQRLPDEHGLVTGIRPHRPAGGRAERQHANRDHRESHWFHVHRLRLTSLPDCGVSHAPGGR